MGARTKFNMKYGTCVKSGTGSSSSSLDINSQTSISSAASYFEPKYAGNMSCKEENKETQETEIE